MLPREHWSAYFSSSEATTDAPMTLQPTPEAGRAVGRALAVAWLLKATKNDLAGLLSDEPTPAVRNAAGGKLRAPAPSDSVEIAPSSTA